MTDMTIAPATLGPLGPFDLGYLDGEIDYFTNLDRDRATDRGDLAFDHDPAYSAGYLGGYGAHYGADFEYAHHHAPLEIKAFLATAHWGETPSRVPTRREVRQARKAHRTHR